MEKENILSIFGKKKKEADRVSYSREYDVSPIFPFTNTADILATKEELFDFETRNGSTGKYLPFNSLRIINNSTAPIYVYINQKRDRGFLVPAGVIQPIDNTIAPAISSVLIKNADTSATINAGEINLLISKDNVTTDLLAKKMFRLLKGAS